MTTRPLIYRIIEAVEGDERLSTTDRLVLVLLTKYANRDGNGCTVSNDRLARGAAVSNRTVRRSLSNLAERGYISRNRRRQDTARTAIEVPQDRTLVATLDGQDRTPMATLNSQDRTLVASRPDTGRQRAGHPCPPTVLITDLSTDLEENMSDPSARTRLSDGPTFDEFYDPYPRHEKRADAEKAWKRLSAENRRAALEALPRHLDQWHRSRTEAKYIPLPRSWLNGKRWEDEITDTSRIKALSNLAGSGGDGSVKPQTLDDGDQWMVDTYRKSDFDAHQHNLDWFAYTDEVAELPPRTAPTFEEWSSAREVGGGIRKHMINAEAR